MLRSLGQILKFQLSTGSPQRCSQCCIATGAATKQKTPYSQSNAFSFADNVEDGPVPKINIETFHHRRQLLMDHIHRDSNTFPKTSSSNLVLIPSGTKQYMSESIPYQFRQNTDFLYLTGFNEPDCLLAMHSDVKNSQKHHSVLFIPKFDEDAIRWEGPKADTRYITSFFGIHKAFYDNELENYLCSHISNNSNATFWFDYLSSPTSKMHQVIKDFITCNNNSGIESPRYSLQRMRVKKMPVEIDHIERSCEIAGESLTEVMKFSFPGVLESHLHAKMDFECRLRGADCLAFPSVVAGGSRANTIHYISNNHHVNNNETVLMDAGCEFQGYSSDLTRTWPVSGKFTEPQREIYELVLSVQEELIDLCHSFPSLDHLFKVMCQKMGVKLQQLGIVPASASLKAASDAAYSFCPHHVGHYLGMDVHDTSLISRGIKIQPGMVITIEPGIYIQSDDLNVPERYRGLCVRIEDDILITKDGPKVLTANCPKSVEDIESLLSFKS